MAESQPKIVYKRVDPTGGVKDVRNPIIFIHAMLCSKEIWTNIPQSVANSTGRKVYTYDARNHGASDYTNDSNFRFNVDDLFHVMDLIKEEYVKAKQDAPKQFILVGHDMGGMTVIGAALRKPADFEKVFVVEMYPKKVPTSIINSSKQFVTEWTECVKVFPKDTSSEDVTSRSIENLYKKLEFKEENEKQSYLKGKFLYKETQGYYDANYNSDALVNALNEYESEFRNYDGTYKGPACFFYGTESHYKIPNEIESIKNSFPNAVLIPFEGGSHFFVTDKPTKLAEELTKHINNS